MNKFFLPYYFKYVGLILFLLGLLVGYLLMKEHYMPDFLDVPVFAIHSQYIKKTVMGMSQTNLMDEIALLFTQTGLILLMFSKQKRETPEVMTLRVEAIFAAVIANYLFFTFVTLFIFGIVFTKMVFFYLISLPLFYLVIFNILIFKQKREKKE